jgi:hypothetical protein
LYNVNGTKNLRDWKNNLKIAVGLPTEREKVERNYLERAKKKHKPKDTTITGHSQLGYYASKISQPTDKVITYNKASLGDTIKKNETHYRTALDPVSILTVGNKHSKVINQPVFSKNMSFINPLVNSVLTYNPVKEHKVDNLAKNNITI